MKIFNKKLEWNFIPIEKYEAGIALIGAEVKPARAGKIKLDAAHVKIIDNEAFLINAEIPIYEFARPDNYDPKRTRKLLLKKAELIRIKTKIASGGNLTVVPVSCYNKGPLLKLEIALAKGKKAWEKKRVEKNRDEKRRVEKELKEVRG